MEIENKRSREFETIGPWKYSRRMRRMLEKDLWNGTIERERERERENPLGRTSEGWCDGCSSIIEEK